MHLKLIPDHLETESFLLTMQAFFLLLLTSVLTLPALKEVLNKSLTEYKQNRCFVKYKKAGEATITAKIDMVTDSFGLYVYNQTAHNVKFSMYALSALIVVVILVILLIVNFAGSFNRKATVKGGVK